MGVFSYYDAAAVLVLLYSSDYSAYHFLLYWMSVLERYFRENCWMGKVIEWITYKAQTAPHLSTILLYVSK